MKRNQMKKKMNNKGFSLVELIVVMAIMAILAVTLAPRLTHYIEKARVESDREVVNAVYNSARLGLADEDIKADFTTYATTIKTTSADSTPAYYAVTLDAFYDKASDIWTVNASKADDNKFYDEISKVIGKFTLKSKDADDSSDIIICYDISNDQLSVFLEYDGFDITPADPANTVYKAGMAGKLTGSAKADYVVTE